MFIQTERTPNPATLKFLPGRPVYSDGSLNFSTVEEAARSPMATEIFEIDGVTGVFYGLDFVTVTKQDDADWAALKPQVLGAIMQHFSSGGPLVLDDAAGEEAPSGFQDAEEDKEIIDQIKVLLEEKVRPTVAQDGGDIVYQGFKEGVVYLQMQGSCAGCPSSTATLKYGIENLLRHFVPEVTEVQAV